MESVTRLESMELEIIRAASAMAEHAQLATTRESASDLVILAQDFLMKAEELVGYFQVSLALVWSQ